MLDSLGSAGTICCLAPCSTSVYGGGASSASEKQSRARFFKKRYAMVDKFAIEWLKLSNRLCVDVLVGGISWFGYHGQVDHPTTLSAGTKRTKEKSQEQEPRARAKSKSQVQEPSARAKCKSEELRARMWKTRLLSSE